MKKREVVYIVSDINKALAFEWIATHIHPEKISLSFLLLNPGPTVLESFLKEKGIPVTTIVVRGKKDWPAAWRQVFSYLRKARPDIVHCHLLQASILGLSAARAAGVRSRIHTRHHSAQHHVYHPKGVWWDNVVNKLSTRIIATSTAVKDILVNWEKVPEEKISLIVHGFELDSFHQVSKERVEAIREKYNISGKQPVIGVISRFIELKGVQYIIPAFRRLLEAYPEAVLLLFNADGDYAGQINKLLADLPEEDCFRKIMFEEDIAAAFHVMDAFVHVPIDNNCEAFGQIYVEALAAGIPSVFTLSGVASDFIVHGENAVVVPYKDSNAIYRGLLRVLSDKGLRQKLQTNGWNVVRDRFTLREMIEKLEELYTNNTFIPTIILQIIAEFTRCFIIQFKK